MKINFLYLIFIIQCVHLASTNSTSRDDVHLFFRSWVYDQVIPLSLNQGKKFDGFVIDYTYNNSMTTPYVNTSTQTQNDTMKFVYNYMGNESDARVANWCKHNQEDYSETFDIHHDLNIEATLHCASQNIPAEYLVANETIEDRITDTLIRDEFENILDGMFDLWTMGIKFEMKTCNIILIPDQSFEEMTYQLEYDFHSKTAFYYVRRSEYFVFDRCSRNRTYTHHYQHNETNNRFYHLIGDFDIYNTLICDKSLLTTTISEGKVTDANKLESTCTQDIYTISLAVTFFITLAGTIVIMMLINKKPKKEQEMDDIGMLVFESA